MDPTATLGLILSIIMGFIASHFAAKRGRNPYVWLAIGIFFGLLGIIALFLLPEVKKEDATDKVELPNTITVTAEEVVPEPERLIMLKDWFCIDASTKSQLGPMNFDALKDLWSKEKLHSGSYVWSEGMPAWLPISQLPDLLEALDK